MPPKAAGKRAVARPQGSGRPDQIRSSPGSSEKLRGPGETQLEDDRRQVRERIQRLKQRLVEVDRTRRITSKERESVPYPVVALAGYTNAGKYLSHESADGRGRLRSRSSVRDPESTVRALTLPSGATAMLVDTVGFISKLPHELVEAFKGTLEQVVEADLILHVVDAAHPDVAARLRVVDEILRGLGAPAVRELLVYNKADLPAQQGKTGRR